MPAYDAGLPRTVRAAFCAAKMFRLHRCLRRCSNVGCYTRSTASYKLRIEYNLLLTQRLTSYPLVLGVLYCGSSSFARVTNELPLGVLWLLCVAGTSFARSTAQLSCLPLSLPTQLSESKAAAYIDNPAALPL
jgi:hypothetical protein